MFAFFSPGPVEICIVCFVAILLIGPKMVPKIARSLGAIGPSFRRGLDDGKAELESAKKEIDDALKSGVDSVKPRPPGD